MQQDIIKKVSKYIETWRLLEPGDRVLVAVSGGSDSVALALILHELTARYRLKMYWVHVNHQLRSEAEEDAHFVHELAVRFGISLSVEKISPLEVSQQKKRNLEEVARILRYEVFEKVANQIGVSRIALAHHLNDQSETVLMRIIRGSGLKGASGMFPCQRWGKRMIIRPLLGCTKNELRYWLSSHHLAWREDDSNKNEQYFRNKIRHHLIPLLEKSYNKKIQERLASLASCFQQDQFFIEQSAKNVYQQLAIHSPDKVEISLNQLLLLPRTMARQVSRLAIAEIQGNLQRINFRHWLELEDLYYFRPGRSQVHLPKGVIAQKLRGRITFYRGDIYVRGEKEETKRVSVTA